MNTYSSAISSESHIGKALSDVTEELQQLNLRTAQNIWLIGQRLDYINKKKLYVTEGYRSFESYYQSVLGYSKQTVYSWIKISQHYPIEDVGNFQIDPTKLIEALSIKDSRVRRAYLYRIQNQDITVRELKKDIKEINTALEPYSVNDSPHDPIIDGDTLDEIPLTPDAIEKIVEPYGGNRTFAPDETIKIITSRTGLTLRVSDNVYIPVLFERIKQLILEEWDELKRESST
jgi:hypothetical protein